jgi:WD40 repeat protein
MTSADTSTDDRHPAVLEAFARALRREAHILAEQPDLTWQQLHNRLQWEGEAVEDCLAPERERRNVPSARLWFRTRTPFREAAVLVRTLRHEGVRVCALAPNGVWLCSVSDDLVKLWSTRSGGEHASFSDAEDPVVSCAFDCNSNFLITGSRRGTVHIRDSRTFATVVELRLGSGGAHCVTSPVEPLAAVAAENVLRVVELPSGWERISLPVADASFSCCAFSNGGELIATGDKQGTLGLWSTDTLDEQIRAATGRGIKACAVSPNLAFVAAVPVDKEGILLLGGPDETGKPQLRALSLLARVNDCCMSPDGRWLACASDLDDLRRPMCVLEGHTAGVVSCAFAANGSLLATASRDGTVKLWTSPGEPSRGGTAGHRQRVTALAFALDGSFLTSASADMTLKTWDPAPTAERHSLEGHLAPVWDCKVLKGNSLIASAAGDGTIRLWDVASARETRVLRVGSASEVKTLAYSPDGSLLAAGHNGSVTVWELATGERIKEADIAEAGPGDADRRVQDCAFTLGGAGLLVACEDATLRLWDIDGWCELAVLRGHTEPVSCCAAVPETSFGVSGSRDGTLRLWDLGSGTEQHVFVGHEDEVWDCAVSGDGAILASVGWDGTLRLWDLASRIPIGEFSVPVRLRSVALDPSKLRVAIGDHRGWVRVLDVMPMCARSAPDPDDESAPAAEA